MIHRPIRYHFFRVLRQNSTPRQLAAGIAVGVFVGLAVPYGLQVAAIVLAALVFRRFNRIAALLGCSVTNPLTTPFIYLGYYRLGKWMTGWRVSEKVAEVMDDNTLWEMLKNHEAYRDTLLAMGLAAVVIAALSGLASYFIALPLIARYQERRAQRLKSAFGRFIARAKAMAHVADGKAGEATAGEHAAPPGPDTAPPGAPPDESGR
jgi:uncharacterized protein (DUF2062 family)